MDQTKYLIAIHLLLMLSESSQTCLVWSHSWSSAQIWTLSPTVRVIGDGGTQNWLRVCCPGNQMGTLRGMEGTHWLGQVRVETFPFANPRKWSQGCIKEPDLIMLSIYCGSPCESVKVNSAPWEQIGNIEPRSRLCKLSVTHSGDASFLRPLEKSCYIQFSSETVSALHGL